MTIKSRMLTHPSAWTTVIDRRYTVAIPPGRVSWKVGQRVFWCLTAERPGMAVVSDSPRGAVRKGRYLSSRIQRRRPKVRLNVRKSKTISILDLKGMLTPMPGLHVSIDAMRP